MCTQSIDAHKALGSGSGILFGNPIPAESEAAAAGIQRAVERAVKESTENGMASRGKAATPWLLQRVKELSAGSSVESSAPSVFSLL